MESNNIEQRISQLEAKIDATYNAVEKMRKYMLIVTWVTIGMVVLPVIGLMLVVPVVMSSYTSALGGL